MIKINVNFFIKDTLSLGVVIITSKNKCFYVNTNMDSYVSYAYAYTYLIWNG